MDRILVPGLRLEARLGVTAEERADPQELTLEIELRLDLSDAGARDALDATVDYEEICVLAEAVVTAREYRLIEAVAEAVAAEVLGRFAAAEVRVQVRKPSALRRWGVPHAAVEVTRRRDGR